MWADELNVPTAEETELKRFNQIDAWVGWGRFIATVLVALLCTYIWRLRGDWEDSSWIPAALICVVHGSIWLIGAKTGMGMLQRDIIGWYSLLGDAVLIGLAGRFTPYPYSAWMPLWCLTTLCYVHRYGRFTAPVMCLISGGLALAHNFVLSPERASPEEWLRQGITLVCVGVIGWLTALTNKRDVDLRRNLSELATRDGLTGLYNQRFFREMLEREHSRVRREGGELSVLMIDVDHFKLYNDTWGHLAANEALCVVARLIVDSVRNHDLVFRYGGDEFAIILPNSGVLAARKVAERALHAIRSHPFEHGPVTVSIGWSSHPSLASNPSQLVEQADKALYQAKDSGRDRAVGYNRPHEER